MMNHGRQSNVPLLGCMAHTEYGTVQYLKNENAK